MSDQSKLRCTTLVMAAQVEGWAGSPTDLTDDPWTGAPEMQVDVYCLKDRDGCLRVFDSNTPTFFASQERATFETFLDNLPGPFWVARDSSNRDALGCGGVSLADDGETAWLRWGMVYGSHHTQGIGTHLLERRLAWIAMQPAITRVRVATAESARGFFERKGFSMVTVTVDGFGQGMSRYDLELGIEKDHYMSKGRSE